MAHWTRTDAKHPAIVRGNRKARAATWRAVGDTLLALVVDPPLRQVRTWRLRMRMEELDDHMLDDIGLRRSDIRRLKAPRRRRGVRA